MPISEYLGSIREIVGSAPLVMPGVSMVCFDNQRRLLLANHGGEKGWAIPGGSVDPSDLPADTAVREMWEETRLHVEPVRIIGVYGGSPNFRTTYANGDVIDYKDTVFECRILGGEMTPDKEEICALRFFSREELAGVALPEWVLEILPHIYSPEERTHFQPVTWRPPADGIRKGGISDYMRNLRAQIGQRLVVMPCAAGIVRDEQNRVLMQKRSDNGLWSLPGGAIDPHETPVDAVVREIWEETGVIAEPTRVAGVFAGPKAHVAYPHGDQVAVYSYVFDCKHIEGDPTVDGDESLEVAFFECEQLMGLTMTSRSRRRLSHILQPDRQSAYFDPPIYSAGQES